MSVPQAHFHQKYMVRMLILFVADDVYDIDNEVLVKCCAWDFYATDEAFGHNFDG